ncbi:chondroitin sulfate synthase 2-like [Tubulanus polymorphus]|uniref:chondroitin sulfate synthase 2-like n=1 Tax=Tubulanus polymorphus TaxID=672921 RepID=UPI003DA339C2
MRIKTTEIVKFLTFFVSGMVMKALFDLWRPYPVDCTRCVQIHCQRPLDVKDIVDEPGVRVQLREPFRPGSINDVIPYEYFDGKYFYKNPDGRATDEFSGHERADIHDLVARATSFLSLSDDNNAKNKLKRVVNGYRRFDPLRGEEYILDLEFAGSSAGLESGQVMRHRLELVKPVDSIQLTRRYRLTEIPMVTVMLPVFVGRGLDSDAIVDLSRRFVDRYDRSRDSRVTLLVVLFVSGEDRATRTRAAVVRAAFERLRMTRRANVKLRVIETRRPFSRTLGLDLASKQVAWNSLMFFADLHVRMTREFLTRCRLNAELGVAVYYPVPFSLYNSTMVERFTPRGFLVQHDSHLTDINQYTGRWATDSYSMVCLYRKDYDQAGFDTKQTAWGGEDRSLYKKHVLNHNLKVIRALDPGLIHFYNEKHCDIAEMSVDQQLMCNLTALRSYASQEQLARKVFQQQQQQP